MCVALALAGATQASAAATLNAVAGQPFSGAVGTGQEACPIDPDTARPGHPAQKNCQLFGSDPVTGQVAWGDGASSAASISRDCPQTLGSPYCTITVSGTHTYTTGGTYAGSFTWTDTDPNYGTAGSGTFTMLVSGGSRPCSGTVPVAVTGSASAISNTGATVSGSVNPCGTATGARFAFGTSTDYGSTTATQQLGAGTSPVAVTGALTNLTPGTTYHYRVEALPANNALTPPGVDQTFTTTGVSPFTLTAKPPLPLYDGTPFARPVAHIDDGGAGVSKASFSATIDWGDGSPASPGAIVDAAGGGWDVGYSHEYPVSATDSTDTITVKVTKAGHTQTLAYNVVVVGRPKPRPPVAQFTTQGDAYSHQERFPVTFDASASYSDCEAQVCNPKQYTITHYNWTVDGQSKTCGGPLLTAIFPNSERARVTLQVFDSASPEQASAVVEQPVDIRDSEQGSAQPRPLFLQCGDASNLKVVDVRPTGIEVNQGVQEANPSNPGASWTFGPQPTDARYAGVPLSAGHPTVARVFGDAAGFNGTLDDVKALLHAYDAAGHELPDSPLFSLGGPHSIPDHHSAGLTWDAVKSQDEPFDFVLPAAWTHGTISLKAELVPPAEALDVSCTGCQDFTLHDVHFTQLPDLHVIPVRLDYAGNPEFHDPPWWGKSATSPANPPAVDNVFDTARTVMPMPLDVPPYQGVVDVTNILTSKPVAPGGKNWQRQSQLAKDDQIVSLLDFLANFSPLPKSDAIVAVSTGFTDYTGPTDVGIGGILSDQRRIAVVNVNRPLDSVAHELGHEVGRPHASYCNGAGDPNNGRSAETWPPDEEGALQGVGLDTRSQTLFADPLDSGHHYNNYMSYCKDAGQWVSVRGWNEMFNWHPAADQARTSARSAAAGRLMLHVNASVSAAGTSIDDVSLVPGGALAPGAPSPYRLVAKSRSGVTLATVPMTEVAAHGDGAGPTLLLSGAIGKPGRVASVSIVNGGTVLATRTRSAHAPRLRLLGGRRVIVPQRHASTVPWAASDADHDRLLIQVDYSADGGRHWSGVYIGSSPRGVRLANRLLSASRDARVRVTVSDGFNETTITSGRFVAPGAPPVVTITQPAPHLRIAGDSTLVLAGSAFDDRGARLTGRSLTWYSGSRRIGAGSQLSVGGLAPGRRAITLRAVDRLGRPATARVSVQVLRARPGFLMLAIPHSLAARARKLRLRVRTSIPATLSIGRARFAVSRTTLTLTLHVARSRRPLVLTLKLSAWGAKTSQQVIIQR
jgi:hypothetical protein